MRFSIFFILYMFCFSIPVFADYRQVLKQIESKVESEYGVGKYSIDMEYFRGDIILKGTVSSKEVKDKIGEIALSVPKVVSIRNLLAIDPSFADKTKMISQQRTDDMIEAELAKYLSDDRDVHISNFSIDIDNGIATLRGDAPSFKEVDKVLSIALMTDGVRDIINRLTVEGHDYPQFATQGQSKQN